MPDAGCNRRRSRQRRARAGEIGVSGWHRRGARRGVRSGLGSRAPIVRVAIQLLLAAIGLVLAFVRPLPTRVIERLRVRDLGNLDSDRLAPLCTDLRARDPELLVARLD